MENGVHCVRTFDCIVKGYLHSSHLLMSELLIHLCKQSWCTYLSEPQQQQGAIRGWFVSIPQWQILQKSPFKLSVDAAVVKLSPATDLVSTGALVSVVWPGI